MKRMCDSRKPPLLEIPIKSSSFTFSFSPGKSTRCLLINNFTLLSDTINKCSNYF
uniref:Uncharacterized protein n=1 Tax=Rhizophagus irregularis (strain DAOM 181602 / DAOM 197198 / MUCL 43194) TaxID=747089 RepID=U9TVR5_RHIID